MKPILVLMNGALRLSDHPALYKASETGVPVIPVYIYDDESRGVRPLGGASKLWLLKSLDSLTKSLDQLDSKLIIRRGATLEVLRNLVAETDAGGIYMTRRYSPWTRDIEEDIHGFAVNSQIECRRFGGNLLVEPEEPKTLQGKPYGVFSPFWRKLQEILGAVMPLPLPQKLEAPAVWPESESLSANDITPKPHHWFAPIEEAWKVGEAGAAAKLKRFTEEAVHHYAKGRDLPGHDFTSQLSPYLAFGEISPRQIWYHVQEATEGRPECEKGAYSYLREIGWREFSYHLLFHNKEMPNEPLRQNFRDFPWFKGEGDTLTAWQKGKTGFPIIDAGMRQLWQTGWMHNRVRMIVASFLVKDLLWHWHEGEEWFWDTLVDADIANNTASWQWVAGCGADAAPFFRIFNPVTQGEKFDPDGTYIRKYVPELKHMPDKFIHRPFEAPLLVLKEADVELGDTYPEPIVDRKKTRVDALAAYETVKVAK